MQPLPGYQDLFPILPSFQHAPRLQIRAAFISPIAETPDIHTPSIRQHVMRSQNQAPFVLYTIFLPLCWAFHMRSFSLLVGFIETANGIACPPPKERILLRITVSKHSRTCMMALLFWSTWQARNVLLFCSLEDCPRASAWLGGSCLRPTFLRPLLLIREIKRLLVGFPGAVQKKRRNKRSYFRT